MYYDGEDDDHFYTFDDVSNDNGEFPQLGIIIKDKTCSRSTNKYRYKFSHRSDLTGAEMMERAIWCEENLLSNWLIGFMTDGIETGEDAVAYKLMWI